MPRDLIIFYGFLLNIFSGMLNIYHHHLCSQKNVEIGYFHSKVIREFHPNIAESETKNKGQFWKPKYGVDILGKPAGTSVIKFNSHKTENS